MTLLIRKMALGEGKVGLKESRGGRMSQELMGDDEGLNSSHGAGKKSWAQVPEQSNLKPFVGLFTDPMFPTNI
jgi:hypothetical protein